MSGVIRRARLAAEPVLLQTGVRPAAWPKPAPAEVARVAQQSVESLLLPEADALFPAELATLESELRQRLAAEREQALGEAAATGREAGIAEGRAAGRDEWTERVQRLDKLLASATEQLAHGVRGAEDLMVELAFESACRIIGPAAVTRDGAQAIVRTALEALHERENVVIRVATGDLEALRAQRAELTRVSGARGLELVADERVALGGCLIETGGGGLDARLETQLRRLQDLLLAARAAEDAP